jgi:hypothetical protein
MMCSNGNAAFGVPGATLESGSEFGPRVPLETVPEGNVAAALEVAVGLGEGEAVGDATAPGAGDDPVWVTGSPVFVPFGTGEVPPTDAPPLQAARPIVAAPADLRIKPLRLMRNRDM